ncbi:DUF4179 domain-containing protein [Paenibacillus septentrionalis]|uniref:DUF4179 domain-containing protein n=1 Tax=Paenibacillus septentrionalis TaxID=429342 RepID=A0ABW1V8S7_9BACL
MDEHGRYMAQLDTIDVPQLEHAILAGQQRAKQELRQARLMKLKKRLIASTVAVCLMLALIVGIRVSPVLASTLSHIPFVSELVELIAGSQDKGILDIIDNEYYEVLDTTVEKNGISLTIKGVVADESGMIVFYRVTTEEPSMLLGLNTSSLQILQDGKDFEASSGYSFFYREGDDAIEDQFRMDVPDKIDYSSKQFEFVASFTDRHKTVITIPFELKQPIAETKSYPINKKVEISGQTIWLDNLNISPIRAELKLRADESNSWRLLHIVSLELIDEHGEQWGAIKNGITGRGSFDEGYSLFIQSNYFRNPQQLTLRLGQIEALPKGEDYIEVDFEKQEVLYQPSYIQGELSVMNDMVLYEGVQELNEHYRGTLVSTGIDASGKEIFSSFGSAITGDQYIIRKRYELEDYTNPVRLYIWSYPHYLPGSIEVDIPMLPQ